MPLKRGMLIRVNDNRQNEPVQQAYLLGGR
jgi:hypothetical protein